MFTLFPMVTEFTSPRTTALNHTLQSSPILTSPTIVAFSARKQFFPRTGVLPFTDFISAIFCLTLHHSKIKLYYSFLKSHVSDENKNYHFHFAGFVHFLQNTEKISSRAGDYF